MFDQQAIEQRLVAAFQGRQADVLFQVVALGPQMLQFQRHLFLDGELSRREQALQAERSALFERKGRVFVQERVLNELDASGLHFQGLVVIERAGHMSRSFMVVNQQPHCRTRHSHPEPRGASREATGAAVSRHAEVPCQEPVRNLSDTCQAHGKLRRSALRMTTVLPIPPRLASR